MSIDRLPIPSFAVPPAADPGPAAWLPGVAFPGQISDAEVLGRGLQRRAGHPLVRALEQVIDQDPGSADYTDTRVAQPCTYTLGLIRAWESWGEDAPLPLAMGHSLGEITAMAFAGAIDPYDGLRLVRALGEVGHEQYLRRPSALVAVVGLDRDTVEWQRRLVVADSGGILEPSGYNDARQTVLCGDERAVTAMVKYVRDGVGSARRLAIRGAYHSSLMVDVLPQWRAAVAATRFRPPRLPLLSSVDLCVRSDTASLPELLGRWLVLPVRWHEATEVAARRGVAALWDAGPADVLRRIGRRTGAIRFVERAGAVDDRIAEAR